MEAVLQLVLAEAVVRKVYSVVMLAVFRESPQLPEEAEAVVREVHSVVMLHLEVHSVVMLLFCIC